VSVRLIRILKRGSFRPVNRHLTSDTASTIRCIICANSYREKRDPEGVPIYFCGAHESMLCYEIHLHRSDAKLSIIMMLAAVKRCRRQGFGDGYEG
jgi:hypothetical protein